MQRKALPFKSPWDKVPHRRSCLTCHSSLPLHSLVKLACLKPSVCSSLPLTSVHHLLPSFLHSYFWSPVSTCVAQILGNFSNPPSWKLPFPPLNHPLTGPLVLGLGKYHSTSSLLTFPESIQELACLYPNPLPLAQPRRPWHVPGAWKISESSINLKMQENKIIRSYCSLFDNICKTYGCLGCTSNFIMYWRCAKGHWLRPCGWGKYVKPEIDFPNIPL